jgi:hypothetical protein
MTLLSYETKFKYLNIKTVLRTNSACLRQSGLGSPHSRVRLGSGQPTTSPKNKNKTVNYH